MRQRGNCCSIQGPSTKARFNSFDGVVLKLLAVPNSVIDAGCNEPTEQNVDRVQINLESWEGGGIPEID